MSSAETQTEIAAAISDAVQRASGPKPSISKEEALLQIAPHQLQAVLHEGFGGTNHDVLTSGLGASPGAAVGRIVLTADEAMMATDDVILVRDETSPADVHGMQVAAGILTTKGGLASHAAVVARGWGKPAVCGAENVQIETDHILINGERIEAGETLSIDGGSGEVIRGSLQTTKVDPIPELATLLTWADEVRDLTIRANADTASEAKIARNNGAEGIGLCRTEHMFLDEQRLPVIRRMILAETPEQEAEALNDLRESQYNDFVQLLEQMDGLPVTVRLLDPPLHEFLPNIDELIEAAARNELDEQGKALLAAAQKWRERNPMIGTRGVRLAWLKPGLYEMQTQALLDAIKNRISAGGEPSVEIMIPLTVSGQELAGIRQQIETVVEGHEALTSIKVGTMIETPRAALVADELAKHSDFFSFGTNDLTQLVFGFSRDDVESRIMGLYLEHELLDANPFERLDPTAVVELIRIGIERGRNTKPDLAVGVCGEHGGDPTSINLLAALGVDYVSCSPPRIPIARLAAAHATITASS